MLSWPCGTPFPMTILSTPPVRQIVSTSIHARRTGGEAHHSFCRWAKPFSQCPKRFRLHISELRRAEIGRGRMWPARLDDKTSAILYGLALSRGQRLLARFLVE